MSNTGDIVSSIRPSPDEEMTNIILRLKHNPDFKRFYEVMVKGRTGVLAYLSCAPAWSEKQVNFIQGRVHELSDLARVVDTIEEIHMNFQESKSAEGGGNG